MSKALSLQTDRARALILAFAVSRNSSEFCRFLTRVPLRDLKARTAILVRKELDGSLRLLGQHGLTAINITSSEFRVLEEALLQRAISEERILSSESSAESRVSDKSFLAIPFNSGSPVRGAIGIGFAVELNDLNISPVEVELVQLLGELIAVNSLPRMRATGMLSKIYFDSDSFEDVSDFSDRQLRILDEMAIGKTNVQIAKSLNVSESTVKQDTVKMFKMLGVNNRQRAVAMGKEMGII